MPSHLRSPKRDPIVSLHQQLPASVPRTRADAADVGRNMLHQFLDFELDEEQCELRAQGEPIATQSRVLAMITYLLKARERVVSRDELMDALWDGHVVSDAAISQVIMLARKALRDEGESQRVIRTVRGRGIRFVAEVESRTRALRPVRSRTPSQLPTVLASPLRAPLLGRDRELRFLSTRLERAEVGQGGLVLVEGDPGIGKTTLVEELAAQALERGFEVVWGRAWEVGGAPPFWPWIQVLRAIAGREGPERMQSFLGAGAAELLPLLPELATRAAAHGDLLSQELDSARSRFRQFDVLSRLLHHLCGRATPASARAEPPDRPRRPWLIILDDLHAADEATVQLARFLMPDLRELGLLLVGTYRNLERADKDALSALVESCGDHSLRLSGLSPSDVSELAGQRLGQPAPQRFSGALHALSAGNPLLVAALCDRIDPGDPEPLLELSHLADFALPERIASAVRRHLAELPEPTRQVLSAASVLGRELSLPQLALLLECREDELLSTLAPALRRGVLRPASSAGRLTFSHALVWNTVYAELTPQLRLSLHRKVGELLELLATPAEPGAALPLHELAHHFFLAAAHGCRDKAMLYAERAAQHACQMMAHETAAVLYDRAAALAELENLGSARVQQLLCQAGSAWYRSGELERAGSRYDRASQLARAANDAQGLAQAAVLCANALRGTLVHDTVRQQQLRDALALLPPDDSSLRARLLSVSTLGMRSPDTLAEREAATRAGVAMARRLGDVDTLLWTLNARHLVMWGGAAPGDMIAVAREMSTLAKQTSERELMLDSLLWLAYDCCEAGDVPTMMLARQEFAAAVQSAGSPWHRYMAVAYDSLEASVYGNLTLAREHSNRALALGLQVQDSLAETFHALRSLFLDLQQQPAGQPQLGAPACVASDYRPFWALHLAEYGHSQAAQAMLSHTLLHERDLLDALRRPVLAAMAQVSARLADLPAAEQIYDMLLPAAGQHLALQACVYMGPVNHYLGLLAHALGRRAAAGAHFENAICSVSAPMVQAQIHHAYGLMLSSDRAARQQARTLLSQAAEAAQRFGMSRLHDQSRAALAAVR